MSDLWGYAVAAMVAAGLSALYTTLSIHRRASQLGQKGGNHNAGGGLSGLVGLGGDRDDDTL